MDVDQPSPSAQDTQSIGQYYFSISSPTKGRANLIGMGA